MNRFEVSISEQAEQDLRGIFEYIAFELLAPENADSQLTRIEIAIEKLNSFPEKHRRYEKEPWKSRNLRIMPVDNYCVFYIPDKETMTITVIRVIYGGRDIEKQLNDFTEDVRGLIQ